MKYLASLYKTLRSLSLGFDIPLLSSFTGASMPLQSCARGLPLVTNPKYLLALISSNLPHASSLSFLFTTDVKIVFDLPFNFIY